MPHSRRRAWGHAPALRGRRLRCDRCRHERGDECDCAAVAPGPSPHWTDPDRRRGCRAVGVGDRESELPALGREHHPDRWSLTINFLEGRRVLNSFKGGLPLPFLFALSGTAEPFEPYLRAAAAKRGRTAEVRFLPFNTLAQLLRCEADPATLEVFLLMPWDFVPEADWRSGVPESVDEEQLRSHAAETAGLLVSRSAARLLYLPAPLPPLFPDPARSAALGRWLESLAIGVGARVLPADAFALAGYFSSGCPVGGNWIGRVAEALVEAASTQRPEPKKVLVTDLDNVLWSGLIAEDGLDGIASEPSGRGYRHFVYQSLLRRLRREGTLFAAGGRHDS